MTNEVNSNELIRVLVEVFNPDSGNKAMTTRYFPLGRKKNGDKYIKITGLANYYKENASSIKSTLSLELQDNFLNGDRLIVSCLGNNLEHGQICFSKEGNKCSFSVEDSIPSNKWIDALEPLEFEVESPKE